MTARPEQIDRSVRSLFGDRERRYRFLVKANVLNVTLSGIGALLLLTGIEQFVLLGGVLAFFFPVVVASVKVPLMAFSVIVGATMFSLLTIIFAPTGRRKRRFLQVMTDVGAIALTLPVPISAVVFVLLVSLY